MPKKLHPDIRVHPSIPESLLFLTDLPDIGRAARMLVLAAQNGIKAQITTIRLNPMEPQGRIWVKFQVPPNFREEIESFWEEL